MAAGVSAATGIRDQDTSVATEAAFLGASNGEVVAEVVRKGAGYDLDGSGQALQAADSRGGYWHGRFSSSCRVNSDCLAGTRKVVLIADMLPFIKRFPEKPLMWNVAWKTLMYASVALVVHYLERLYEFWKDASSIGGANEMLEAR